MRGALEPPSLFDLITPAFSVLVVFVLAEVFREGARLRRESERPYDGPRHPPARLFRLARGG